MAGKDICITELTKAFSGDPEFSKKYSRIVEDVVTSVHESKFVGLEDKQKLYDDLIKQGKYYTAMKIRNHIEDSKKIATAIQRANNKRYRNIQEAALSIFESKEPNDLSLESLAKVNENLINGQLERDLSRSGTSTILESGDYDSILYKHLFDETDYSGTNAKSINRLLKILRSTIGARRGIVNLAGASMGEIKGYIHRNMHNAVKMVDGGKQEWIAFMMNNLNLKKTFNHTDGVKIAHLLAKDYDTLVKKANPFDGMSIEDEAQAIVTNYSLVDQLNKKRSYHFKDGISTMEYSKKFGYGLKLGDIIVRENRRAARTAALIHTFGTDIRGNYRKIVDMFKKRAKSVGEAVDLEQRMNNAFDLAIAGGEYGHVVNQKVANVGHVIRSIITLAKLGKAGLSAMMDFVPTVMTTKTNSGDNILVSSFKAFTNILSSIPPSSRRATLDSALLAVESISHDLQMRMIGGDYKPGMLNKGVQKFFRFNLLSSFTEINKAANARMYLSDLGNALNGKEVGQINMISRLGLDEAEVALLKDIQSKGHDLNPKALLENRDLFKSREQQVKVIQKIMAGVHNTMNRGSPTPDNQVKRITRNYIPAGTFAGEMVRFIAQFKHTIIKQTMDMNYFARAQSISGSALDPVGLKNTAMYMIMTTGLGFFITELKKLSGLPDELLEGEYTSDLQDRLENNLQNTIITSMERGGALGIFGDAILPVFKDMPAMFKVRDILSASAGPSIVEGYESLSSFYDYALKDDFDLSEAQAKQLVGLLPANNLLFMSHLAKTLEELLAEEF